MTWEKLSWHWNLTITRALSWCVLSIWVSSCAPPLSMILLEFSGFRNEMAVKAPHPMPQMAFTDWKQSMKLNEKNTQKAAFPYQVLDHGIDNDWDSLWLLDLVFDIVVSGQRFQELQWFFDHIFILIRVDQKIQNALETAFIDHSLTKFISHGQAA